MNKKSLNNYYKKAIKKAKNYMNNPKAVFRQLEYARVKADILENGLNKIWDKLMTTLRMLRAYFRGDYKYINEKTILKALSAVLYFVWVADFIPDFIVGVGFIDDITIISWVMSSIHKDLKNFEDWERSQENASL